MFGLHPFALEMGFPNRYLGSIFFLSKMIKGFLIPFLVLSLAFMATL